MVKMKELVTLATTPVVVDDCFISLGGNGEGGVGVDNGPPKRHMDPYGRTA